MGRDRGGNSKTYIATATTTAVKGTSGNLVRIVITETAAGTIVVNDMLGIVASFKASVGEGSYEFDVPCVGKIEVVTGAASKLTVVWN